MSDPRDRIALDSASVRTIDRDGHMHVATSNISRAAVNGYLGREIPDFRSLGLEPDRLYQLLRDPDELEKAAPTFDGKPLLIVHKPVTAEDHDREVTVGSIASPAWSAPFLTAALHIWDGAAIEGIESDVQKELSAAYRYKADMTPGTYDGVRYDGVMRDIVANHVALVESGRAGSDVVVGDAAIPQQELVLMANPAVLSRTALLAAGGLRVYLKPKLATDAKVDLSKIVAGITAKTWKADKAKLKLALDSALAGKLAKDADLEDVVEMLDTLDDVTDEIAPHVEGAVEDEGLTPEEEAQFQALLARRKSSASDEDPPPVPPGKKDDEDDKKPAMDGITKVAMDRAIARARTETELATINRMRAIQEAERIVRPYIGEIVIAQDSAADVYRLALETSGVDVTGVDPSAFGAMVKLLPRPGDRGPASMAMDAAAASEFQKRFPGAGRLKLR